MADNTLDRLSRTHGTDVRRYVASLLAMGANRGQVVEKLRDRFGVTVSKRSVTSWRNNDADLIAMVEELEAVKRDMSPDDTRNPADLLPEPTDPAQASMDLFTLTDEVPAFAELMHRAELDPDFPDDAATQVLLDGPHDDLEAVCRQRLGDWDIHIALGADPADVARVERARAEGTLSESYDDWTRRRKREAATAS